MSKELLRGRVESGTGNFSIWIAKLHEFYRIKTGLNLFPGTLNIRLDRVFHRPPKFMRLEKEEYGGAVSVSLIPCGIFGRKAFILRTDKAETSSDEREKSLIEVATDIKLREAYNLVDGDWVVVEVHDS